MPKSLAKLVGETFRDDSLITRTARHAMAVHDNGYHRHGIYPAEMSHKDRCHRAIHYRLTDAPKVPVPVSIVSKRIFDIGDDRHDWWQNQWWDMGILKGEFYCPGCGLLWWDQSPLECPRCEVNRQFLKYKEVPFEDKEFGLVGRADADLTTDGLIEIKTLGIGSVRHDAPHLINQYGEDWEAIWKNIKYPFPSHRRQGMIYCRFLERDQITFLYEPKFVSAAPKLFVVQYRKDLIDEILDDCLDIKAQAASGIVPERPDWATKSHRTCAACSYKKYCYTSL